RIPSHRGPLTMIRTFVWVVALTLAAGVSLGFFAAEAASSRARTPEAPCAGNLVDAAIDQKVRNYVEYFRLTPAEEQIVREAFRSYDRDLAALMRRLQLDHSMEFKAVAKKANSAVTSATAAAEKRLHDAEKGVGTETK